MHAGGSGGIMGTTSCEPIRRGRSFSIPIHSRVLYYSCIWLWGRWSGPEGLVFLAQFQGVKTPYSLRKSYLQL